MTHALAIPPNEITEFAKLPEPVRKEVRLWLRELRQVFASPKKTAAMKAVAPTLGASWKTVRAKYDKLRKTGDWHVLINRSKCPDAGEKLPEPIIEAFRAYCDGNQRKSKPAHRKLMREWRDGKLRDLPWPPINLHTGIPRGCSYDNLMRHAPTKFEIKAARIGRTAAASERELVYTTRQGLWVGSHYMLDDMWHDFFVNTFAEKQAGRPLELFSHDLFSARKVRWGVRVRTQKNDGSMNGLSERMTRFILAATLHLDGYSPRGTTIVAEHGTAAVSDSIMEDLARDSGGLISLSESGMTGAAAHAGQYPGLSKGNFRHKASLESSNNFVHNEFASLPGQTGMDVPNRPEQLDKMLRHNEALLAAYSQLEKTSPERAALLDFPILELNQFMAVAAEIYGNIESYTDHDLEGWIECGHVIQELCLAGVWMDQRALLQNPSQRDLALALIETGQIASRPRRMSRREVWDMGAGGLIKLPGFGVCHILGNDLAREEKVRNNRFEFEDAEVGPGEHRYQSIAIGPEGRAIELRDGETYQAFVNPFALDTLFVRDVRGGYIGECARIAKPCRGDELAVQRRCGGAAKREAELLNPLRLRHMADARAKAARHEHNARVLGGEPVTPEEKADARTEKSAARFGAALRSAQEKISGDNGSDSAAAPLVETWDDAAETAAPDPVTQNIETW